MKNIVIISVEHRKNSAVAVQEVLSEYGCLIKTRLGITDSTAKTSNAVSPAAKRAPPA